MIKVKDMKKRNAYTWMTALTLAGCFLLTSCAEELDNSNVVYNEEGTPGVKPEFVVSIPRSVVNTRMSNDITQNEGSIGQFRGMDNICLIPFEKEPDASTKNLASFIHLSSIQPGGFKSGVKMNCKVYTNQYVPVNTSHFLFYAKAAENDTEIATNTMDGKFHYGVLQATGLTDAAFNSPADISFSLEPICPQATLADNPLLPVLNELMSASVSADYAPDDKWETSTHPVLSLLYTKMKTLTTCSSDNIAAVLGQLYFNLGYVEDDSKAYALATALRNSIYLAAEGEISVYDDPIILMPQYDNYPTSLGLPAGVARIYWDESSKSFVNADVDDGLFKADLTQFVYPAALWYYTKTPLKASDKMESNNYSKADNWNGVITEIYSSADDVVGPNTMSVALSNPVEYGVGRLETCIKMGTAPFFDAEGITVNIGEGYKLKGMLIGGQNSVAYDFTCKGNENLTIYDREIPEGIVARANVTTAPNQTLALETKSNQIVNVALELVNGGDAFLGADGIIPAGGTFYIVAQLDPTTAKNYDKGVLDKIFMQDHVTKLTVTIHPGSSTVGNDGGLANATNGVPDLTSPYFELGTSVNLEWQEGLILDAGI